ncbi:MAG: HAD family hydrolase [Lachnospiraceae bacterium]|nr:HAD family hydrolase [Lachnospiraceae bacterium]
MYDTILFDLDGTLTDPGIGITNSVMHALKKYSITVTDRSQLYRFIGPPLIESFETFYGFSHEQAVESVGFYREYYRDRGIYENRVYEGIPALLDRLKSAGRRLLLATSKPEEFAVRILEHFELLSYFDIAAGAAMDETRTAKADVIAYALGLAGITDPGSCIMVGDRKHDILGARAQSMASMGVLFGYGSLSELKEAGADLIADTVEDIGRLLGV